MATITGDTKLFGLLSHGVKTTLSPAIHNHAANLFRKDLVYLNFDITADKVAAFLDIFWHMGGQGLNVTMPHKNLVASLVESEGLASVNTLSRTQTGWAGHSTDGDGFLRALERSNATIDDFEMAIVLGSGGAAQAVVSAITLASNDRLLPVIVHRRSRSNDQRLHVNDQRVTAQMLTLRDISAESFCDSMKQTQGQRRLVIQATSAPKTGNSLENMIPALDYMSNDDLFVDLIYDTPSALYFAAIARGLRCQDGLPMLIEQARLSQQIWWGKAASYDDLVLGIKNSGWRS